MEPSILAFFQQAGPVGVVAIFFYLIWQQSEKRYAALAQDFREIVEKNTEVSTRLCLLIESSVGRNNGAGMHRG